LPPAVQVDRPAAAERWQRDSLKAQISGGKAVPQSRDQRIQDNALLRNRTVNIASLRPTNEKENRKKTKEMLTRLPSFSYKRPFVVQTPLNNHS